MGILFEKARENYATAQDAFDERRYNAAASRVYYALRQACINKLTKQGISYEKYNMQVDAEKKDKWGHGAVVRAAQKENLGLNDEHIDFFKASRDLREKADYDADEQVEKQDIDRIINNAQAMIDLLR